MTSRRDMLLAGLAAPSLWAAAGVAAGAAAGAAAGVAHGAAGALRGPSGPPAAARFRSFRSRFDKGAGLGGWHVADHRGTHPFANDWSREQVHRGGDGLQLLLGPAGAGDEAGAEPDRDPGADIRHGSACLDKRARGTLLGAALRRRSVSGHGTYGARLRAARGAGLVTGFFVYTGPAYGTRHDEIDIEILGKDPTRAVLSCFVDGKRRSQAQPLGFDASGGWHDYAFDWAPGRVAWFADGRLLWERRGAPDTMPSVPGRVFVNLWAADRRLAGWAGRAGACARGRAVVAEVSYHSSHAA